MSIERLVPQRLIATGVGTRPVVRVEAFPPGQHPHGSCVKPEYTLVRATLDTGHIRQFGFDRAWIGSDLRMHVSGVNPRDEVIMAWEKGDGA